MTALTVAPADVRSCPGKVRFATDTLTGLRARQINALTGDNLHPYPYTACGWIHLGHPNGGTGIRHGERRTTAEPPSAERIPKPRAAAQTTRPTVTTPGA